MSEKIPPEVSETPDDEIVIVKEGGVLAEYSKSYGIGIDCHSEFIQVSVQVKRNDRYYEYRHEFGTDWRSLCLSRDWAKAVLTQCADPPIDDVENLHYCIESTAVYHFPVLKAWGGTPSIVTPSIAGATKRKTDVLDAKLLALHDLTSVWPESFVASTAILQLRLFIHERDKYNHMAVEMSNRINNYIVRFGITIGSTGSVSGNQAIRSLVEDLASDDSSIPDNPYVCPDGLPERVKPLILQAYSKHDEFRAVAKDIESEIVDTVKSMEWETDDGTVPGDEMLDLLMTVPQIGILTACLWLAIIVTPRRFPNSKALAAYCGLDPSLKKSADKTTSTTKRGGNKQLHVALIQAASRLMRNRNELFGRWGYQMYLRNGRWKKAANAVARKLAISMYHIMKYRVPFSYEKYNLLKENIVIDIPVDVLPALNSNFKRYVRILKENGIMTTPEIVKQYYTCDLKKCHGLGKKFFINMKEFIDNQREYRERYNNLISKEEIN